MIIAALSVAAALAGAAPQEPAAAPVAPIPAPAVANGVLSISPGQKVVVRLTPQGPVIVDDAVVAKKDHRPHGEGLRFSFEEKPEMKVTLLTVENGYDRPVDYDAHMYMPSGADASTSICVVKAHMFSMESWPHRIARLEISNLKFDKPIADDVIRCD